MTASFKTFLQPEEVNMVNTVSMNVFIDIRHIRQHYGLNDYFLLGFFIQIQKVYRIEGDLEKGSATVIWDFHVPL